jgi:hypothetical protein
MPPLDFGRSLSICTLVIVAAGLGTMAFRSTDRGVTFGATLWMRMRSSRLGRS